MSEHSWSQREGWTVCTLCGAVRNYDRPDSQCRGAVKVALREATGGEQGETAEMLEIARLRRERIEQEAVSLEMGGEIAKLNRELAEAHPRLSVIVDEAFGSQEPLTLPALLSRLERLLAERARQHEEVRRELYDVRRELDEVLAELDKLREELDLEKKKRKADWGLIGQGNEMLDRVGKSRDLISRQRDLMERDRDEALARISALEKVAMDCASQCDHCDPDIRIERLSEALRNLINSVQATKTRDTIVLRDIEAALAVIGGQS